MIYHAPIQKHENTILPPQDDYCAFRRQPSITTRIYFTYDVMQESIFDCLWHDIIYAFRRLLRLTCQYSRHECRWRAHLLATIDLLRAEHADVSQISHAFA